MRSNFAMVPFASRRISVSISGKAASIRAIVRRRSEVWYIQKMREVRAAMQGLAQQPGQQRDKGHADQGNAAARDQLLHALTLYLCVIKKQ